jgi:hypothetical protein
MTGLEAYHFLLKGGIVLTRELVATEDAHSDNWHVVFHETYWRYTESQGMQGCSAVGNQDISEQKWNWTGCMLEVVKSWTCEIRAYKPLPQPNLWDLVRNEEP